MAIYDRDYYREPAGGWWTTFGDRPTTTWLIAITCGVFVGQLFTRFVDRPGDLIAAWGEFYLPAILQGQVWRFVTPIFLHDSTQLWHLAINMIVLYWAGSEVEALYGSREFLAFYLAGGAVVGVAMLALGLAGVGANAHAVGASGAVMAVMVLFACHFPHRRILLFFILPMPVWVAVALAIGIDLMGFLGQGRPGIAYSAYLAGAIFGAVYFLSPYRLTSRPTGFLRRRTPTLRLYQPSGSPKVPVAASAAEAAPTPPRPVTPNDEHLEAKLDRVLEKMARTGSRDSLTADEQEVLRRASEVFKRRRGH